MKDPIAFDWGPDGRLWVVEMADYPLGVAGGGRVRVLEDTNGDGKYDKSTVFLDGLPYPTGVMPWREGVLISAAPDILFAADTDGDGRADQREVLYHGFVEGNQQHRVNGFAWGLDNWVYVANGDSGGEITSIKTGTTLNISGRDLRIRPDSGAIDLQSGFTQYGRHRDDWGNWFGGNNSLPLRHYVLADQYLRRNPHARPPSPHNDIAATGNTQIFPVSRVLSHWEGYRSPGPGEPHLFTSACGAVPYRDELFGPEFYGNTFTCEPVHNLVHRRQLIPDGVTFGSRRPDDEASREFLASTDSWFRPTTVRPGPDGALWIADMYRLVIEHTEYIGDAREQELDLRAGEDRGRIYRVYPQQAELHPIPRLGELSTAALAAALDSPSGWQRDTVQRLLIHRGDRAAIQPLQKMLRLSARPLARLHALCTLDGLGAAGDPIILAALADPHPGVRRHAVRIAEPHLPNSAVLTKRLVAMVDDAASADAASADAHLRLQLAYSLGNAADPAAAEALARLAHENRSDQYLRAAVVSSLNEQNLPTVLAAVPKSGLEDEAGQALFGELLQMAAAMQSASTIAEAIGHISQADQDAAPQRWQFEALASLLAGVGKDATPSAPLLRDVSEQISLFREKAKTAAVDPDAEPSLRQAAVNLLGRSYQWAGSEEIELLAQLLEPFQADQLQRAVLEALAARDESQVASAILQRLAQMSPALRAQALDQLLSRSVWIDVLLDELESGRLACTEISSVFQTRLLTHQDEALRGRAEALFKAVNSDRQAVIDAYRESLTAEGDVARGELLFAKHCGTCHRVGGIGQQVGPDLAAITDRSPAALLVSVLDPNRAVEDKYRSYNVLTDDGRARTGIFVAETSTTITLKNAQGKEEVILRNEIDALQNTGSSLMPSGIEKELDVHKMADVLSFVRAQRPPP
ncbi:c-type cytochrome [Pirellulales bacterium]|nr:c-type cytochrome [Pirellulales bacterium]